MELYRDLSIEVTRRCNLRCAHCLRGDQRNSDLRLSVIEELSKQLMAEEFDGILEVTLTGGEPFLKANIIKELLYACPNVVFIVITNGTITTKDAFEAATMLLQRYDECQGLDDPSIGPIYLSNDEFHVQPSAIWERLAIKRNRPMYQEYLIPRGRAYENGFGSLHGEISDNDNITITTTGKVAQGCDYEFGKEKSLGYLKDLSLSKLLLEE